MNILTEADQQWVFEALTRPGAENISTIVAVGEYLSTHVPEDGPVGDAAQCMLLHVVGEAVLSSVMVVRRRGTSSPTAPTRLRVRARLE